MIDIFLKEDACKLLAKKTIVFMGDSNVRAIYKDFLCLMQKTQFIPDKTLKKKMEDSVLGDKLVFHGAKTNGRDYREEREATIQNTFLRFYFLTRVYDTYVEEILRVLTETRPDIIVVNSCLWDVTRWGFSGVEKYKENLKHLMNHLKRILPDCLVIWVTAPPIACELKGGFLVQELQFLKYSLRFHVVEANHYARKVVVESGFDVVDTHYHLKMQIHRRTEDGIHWLPPAVRYVSNLLLTHISLAWDFPLPHRYNSSIMDENLQSVIEDEPIVEQPPIKVEKKTMASVIIRRVKTEPQKDAPPKGHTTTRATPPKRKRQHKEKVSQKHSHHAFLKKEKKTERQKHVRRWHRAAPPVSPHALLSPSPYSSPSSHYGSPANYFDSNHVVYDRHQDSGFISPIQISAHSSHTSSPYMSQTYSGHGYRQRALLPEPYIFPQVIPGQSLQPRIDFTKNHFNGVFF